MGKAYCTYCQVSANCAIVRCLVCPDLELCLVCFSAGAEIGNHKPDHAYTVIDEQKFNVLKKSPEWTADEELLLLDAVEQYGFGNWEDIAAHVKTKDPQSCTVHYGAHFINGNIGQTTLSSELTCNVVDHSTVNGGPLSPSLVATVPPVQVAIADQKMLGYMPLRDDFEREYNNGAESSISSLRVEADDDELDSEFKVAFVDMYRQSIRERFRMHKLARNYEVINSVLTKSKTSSKIPKKKLTRDEKEIQESLKPFSQFLNLSERDNYHEQLKKQKQLRQQIMDLMRYRKNGLTKLDECSQYDEEKYLRDKRKDNKKKVLCSSPSKRAGEVKKVDLQQNGNNNNDPNNENANDPDPSSELLTDTEKRLCTSIGLKPQFYITIKTCILKDYLQRRQGVPVKVRYPMGMEKSHRLKIVNFLRDSGWIGAS